MNELVIEDLGHDNQGCWDLGHDNQGCWDLGHDNQGCWDLGHESPGGVFGCLHDLSLHALRKAGSAHNAPGRWRHNEGLQSLAPQLLLLYIHTDRPAEA